MKIGIDCRLWNESGVGRYVRNLVKNLMVLDPKNEYVLFVQSDACENVKSKMEDRRWEIVKVDIRWHSVEEQLRFPSILDKESLDLVHFPYVSVPIFYNKPFVVTIHDLIPYHFPTGFATTLPLPWYKLKVLGYKFVVSQAAKKAKKIIAVSNATKDEIVDHLGVDSNKVVVTYEGVFANSKLKTQNSKLQLKIQKYFLYVGNAYPHKNLERLIEAFDLFCHPERSEGSLTKQERDSSPSAQNDIRNDIKLVLVGKEDYFYQRLKEKVKNMGLGKSVKFLGEVSDEELISLYRNARALIIPSLMEGFGLPVLEAMGNKCLVLASDIPSLREICGDCAVYFDRYNVDDIAEVMKSVCRNRSNDPNHYSDKIKEGLERAKMFSWGKMAKETLKIYEEIASNP